MQPHYSIPYLTSHGMLFVCADGFNYRPLRYLRAARSACCKWNASKTPLSKYEIYGFMMTIGAVPENTKWIAVIAAAPLLLLAHVARMQQAISALWGVLLQFYFIILLVVWLWGFSVFSWCKKLAKTFGFSISAILLSTVVRKWKNKLYDFIDGECKITHVKSKIFNFASRTIFTTLGYSKRTI